MKELTMQVPAPDKPELGLPYTWGIGENWYVRLDKGTYWFTVRGLKLIAHDVKHSTNDVQFRYATTIRFTDYEDAAK